MKRSFYLVVLIVCISLVFGIEATAQTSLPDVCKKPETSEQERQCNALRIELEQLVKDEKKLTDQKAISGSISKEVSVLNAEINKKKADIAAKNKVLLQLGDQINEKVKTIKTLEEKRLEQEDSLRQILRKKNKFDGYTLAEVMFSQQTLSEFLYTVDQLAAINKGIQDSFNEISHTKDQTNQEKSSLEGRRNRENDVKYELETQKKSVEITQAEKNRTLQISKGQEENYQMVIKDRQARIASIRAELIKFQGSGIASRSISFGEALDYAKNASSKTGVRSALILAIMQQETGFGNNVGGCYVTDLATGDGKGINSGTFFERVMGSGSLPYFENITKNLGIDWRTTPVSCPIDIKGVGTATKYYDGRGYGGAMGYTQFIPSTWVLVEERVRANLGIAAANPWDPQHAVMATAVYLKDHGAASQNYTDERNSACRYYGICSGYADAVMSKATSIQNTINQLNQLNQ